MQLFANGALPNHRHATVASSRLWPYCGRMSIDKVRWRTTTTSAEAEDDAFRWLEYAAATAFARWNELSLLNRYWLLMIITHWVLTKIFFKKALLFAWTPIFIPCPYFDCQLTMSSIVCWLKYIVFYNMGTVFVVQVLHLPVAFLHCLQLRILFRQLTLAYHIR